jgi:hypothetical protein
LSAREVDDLDRLVPPRHQQDPRIIGVVDQQHPAERQVADRRGVALEQGIERPAVGTRVVGHVGLVADFLRRHSGALALASEPGIQSQGAGARRIALDSGFAGHSASKTRVNALMARAPE